MTTGVREQRRQYPAASEVGYHGNRVCKEMNKMCMACLFFWSLLGLVVAHSQELQYLHGHGVCFVCKHV